MEPPITTSKDFDAFGNIVDEQMHQLAGLMVANRIPYFVERIIDAGCGTGTIYKYLPVVRRADQVLLLDLSWDYLNTAKNNVRKYSKLEGSKKGLKILMNKVDLRKLSPGRYPGDLLLFTNTTGFMSIKECMGVMRACPSTYTLANFFFVEDNVLKGKIHPLTDTSMLDVVDVKRGIFTWNFGRITGNNQVNNTFTLQAIKYSSWKKAVKDAGYNIVNEVRYRDFKAERMVLLQNTAK